MSKGLSDADDLRSRIACIQEATWWDRPYDTRLEAIRGMCDLTTDGMTPTDDGTQTVAAREAAARQAGREEVVARVEALANQYVQRRDMLRRRAPVDSKRCSDSIDRREANTWDVAAHEGRALVAEFRAPDEAECDGCECPNEHDGDYGSSGHPGPCPPHTCGRAPDSTSEAAECDAEPGYEPLTCSSCEAEGGACGGSHPWLTEPDATSEARP